jgi:hypothetical protein
MIVRAILLTRARKARGRTAPGGAAGALPTTALLVGVLMIGTGLVVLGGAGCSHYGFSSSVKTHISTIAVPVLLNETLEYGAEQGVTDAIISEFTEDNALRVVREEEADSILRGAVLLYERSVMSYDAAGNPKEYKVRVVAKLSYEDLTKNEIVWEEEIEGWAVYSDTAAGGYEATEEEARAHAFVKLAQDVLSKTVQGW